MSKIRRHDLTGCLCVLAMPVLFCGFIVGNNFVRYLVGVREVQRIVAARQPLLARERLDPNVHAFDLRADPDQRNRLIVLIDVEDPKTYERLEDPLFDDLTSGWIETQFETKIRNGQDLSNTFGFAAFGIGQAVWFLWFLAADLVLSIALPIIALKIFRARQQRRPPAKPYVESEYFAGRPD